MHRTNVYLTEEQELALDARARRAGSTRSAVLRQIIDDDLSRDLPDESVDAAFLALADGYPSLVDGVFDDDPDLRID